MDARRSKMGSSIRPGSALKFHYRVGGSRGAQAGQPLSSMFSEMAEKKAAGKEEDRSSHGINNKLFVKKNRAV